MMYRPKKWKGYHCEELCIECDTNPVDCNKHFEAGADAMLEYLFSQEHQDWLATLEGETCRGRWVFIPDEQVKE